MRSRPLATGTGRHLWHRHPGVRHHEQLTPGERAADHVRNGMGSWSFVIVALVFIAGWMVGNRSTGFDPYPFILLNLVLSCLAALQGAILLIGAKRADQITAELAVHDYETNSETLMLITEVHAALVGKPRLDAKSGDGAADPQPPPRG